MSDDLFRFALRLGDDALVLGHRLSEWCGYGPTLEEDIALANLGLDMIGQARMLYTLAGEIEGKGRDEDQLAYFRDDRAFSNCLLVELPNGDFATTIGRQLLYAAFMQPYLAALSHSKDRRFADIAAKAVKEMGYHVRHSAEWVIRLGDGTVESHDRMTGALDDLWGYTGELFEMDEAEQRLAAANIAPDRGAIRDTWRKTISSVLAEAKLELPRDRFMQRGGRAGRHTEHLGHMLAEMQVLARQHPGARW